MGMIGRITERDFEKALQIIGENDYKIKRIVAHVAFEDLLYPRSNGIPINYSDIEDGIRFIIDDSKSFSIKVFPNDDLQKFSALTQGVEAIVIWRWAEVPSILKQYAKKEYAWGMLVPPKYSISSLPWYSATVRKFDASFFMIEGGWQFGWFHKE